MHNVSSSLFHPSLALQPDLEDVHCASETNRKFSFLQEAIPSPIAFYTYFFFKIIESNKKSSGIHKISEQKFTTALESSGANELFVNVQF